MRNGGMRCLLVGAVVLAGLALAAAAAQAAEPIIEKQNSPHSPADGWQAGTCNSDIPTCSVATPNQFFEQAAGHPQIGFTQFIVKHTTTLAGLDEEPVGLIKDLRVDLPVGLSVNPGATEQCELATFEANPSSCPPGSAVGVSEVTATALGVVVPVPLTATVYNIVPSAGEPARFGFSLLFGSLRSNVYLKAGLDSEGPYREWKGDFHEYFTIEAPEPPLGTKILKNRLDFNGRAGDGTFITTPGTCNDPEAPGFEHAYSTWLRADGAGAAFEVPDFPEGSPFIESPLPEGKQPIECKTIPFQPSIEVEPNTSQTDSPAGAAIEVQLPQIKEGAKQDTANLRTARVTLPAGMGLNPSAASGLSACTDAQLGKGTTNPVSCPPASKIGTVTIESPPISEQLHGEPLIGTVYLGQQLSRDPTSGNEYRVFIDVESVRYGIAVRLIGNVSANPQTGQLTATFAENPQVPFTSFKMTLDGGPQATLTSPPTCAPNATTSQITPWSGTPDATPKGSFTLTSAPGGGGCAKTLAERPFAPSFAAKTTNPKGGAYTQFNVEVTRADGNQELKGVDLTLPPGLSAKLAGVSYCPEAALAAASAASGAAELASSSCPVNSLIGDATVSAGSGPSPLQISGEAFLSGPYEGAPLSLAIVTPATAGPFDLGTVVVRVALHLNPETAQVEATSDPIPHVFGGALLDIRSIKVDLDRKQFALNPTNCSPMAVEGTLRGGGSDPTNPAAFSSYPVSSPFQVSDCGSLGFSPKLDLRLFGGTHRAQSPKLRAVLKTQRRRRQHQPSRSHPAARPDSQAEQPHPDLHSCAVRRQRLSFGIDLRLCPGRNAAARTSPWKAPCTCALPPKTRVGFPTLSLP